MKKLSGKPEVTDSGVVQKKTDKPTPSKLVVHSESHVGSVKRKLLSAIMMLKDVTIFSGIAYAWEDMALFADPIQHYVVCGFALVTAVGALLLYTSKME